MPRRRPQPGPRVPTEGGVWLWPAIFVLAGAIGWLWWRAAYPSIADRAPGESPPPPAAREASEGPGDSGRSRFLGIAPDWREIPSPAPAPAATSPPPAETSMVTPRDRIVAVQLALGQVGISAGSIDGVVGSQTHEALRLFQRLRALPISGDLDDATLSRLSLPSTIFSRYTVSAEDLSRLTSIPDTWLGKSTRERLDYESLLELVAEKSHAHPGLLRELNPRTDWRRAKPGESVLVPNTGLAPPRSKAAFVRIHLGAKTLQACDSDSNLLVHFPCSIARRVEKRPVGQLRVVRLVPNPNYRFDPDMFPESAEARQIGHRLMIPPGPNNPVGTAWIGLDRPGYGIHGTPKPEQVGRTESHGCFRLANWNAEYLLDLAWVGMPVYVDP